MSAEYQINGVLDILALDEQQFERFLPDLVAWYLFGKSVQAAGGKVIGLAWVDDGKTGEIIEVLLEKKDGSYRRIEL